VNRHAQFIGFFFEQLLQPSIDRLHKHRASIFGTPDNVILQRENATAVFPISFAYLRQVYRCRSTNTKRAALRTARLFRCPLKATVPKA
jgi:hypothetical protein